MSDVTEDTVYNWMVRISGSTTIDLQAISFLSGTQDLSGEKKL